MSDNIAYVEAKIAALHIKLEKTKNERSQFYYRACIKGWVTTLEKSKAAK